MNHLNHRATALVFAVAVTLATLLGVDTLAQVEGSPTMAQAVSAASRG